MCRPMSGIIRQWPSTIRLRPSAGHYQNPRDKLSIIPEVAFPVPVEFRDFWPTSASWPKKWYG